MSEHSLVLVFHRRSEFSLRTEFTLRSIFTKNFCGKVRRFTRGAQHSARVSERILLVREFLGASVGVSSRVLRGSVGVHAIFPGLSR